MNDSYKVNFNSTISNLRFGTAAKYGGEIDHDDVCSYETWCYLYHVQRMFGYVYNG